MQSPLKPHIRPMALQPLAMALAAGMAALALSTAAPVLAQPQTGETLAQQILAACTGLTWAEQQAVGPQYVACAIGTETALAAAVTLTESDHEQVGAAYAELLRAPVEAVAPAPYPAITMVIASRLQGLIFDYCHPPRGGAETCVAAVRITAVEAQAQAAPIVGIHVQDICGVIRDQPTWRADIVAVVDGLAARAATGTDPVMQGRIDALQAGIAACP